MKDVVEEIVKKINNFNNINYLPVHLLELSNKEGNRYLCKNIDRKIFWESNYGEQKFFLLIKDSRAIIILGKDNKKNEFMEIELICFCYYKDKRYEIKSMNYKNYKFYKILLKILNINK
jgi:hypothetical protein